MLAFPLPRKKKEKGALLAFPLLRKKKEMGGGVDLSTGGVLIFVLKCWDFLPPPTIKHLIGGGD